MQNKLEERRIKMSTGKMCHKQDGAEVKEEIKAISGEKTHEKEIESNFRAVPFDLKYSELRYRSLVCV
jgi:hypothetical protein